jgi:hypothetical protein
MEANSLKPGLSYLAFAAPSNLQARTGFALRNLAPKSRSIGERYIEHRQKYRSLL